MRERKYRVWNANLEKMVYFDLHERDWHLTDGKYPVMDYIGLQDKNQKEIYEGDIINEDFDDDIVERCYEVKYGEQSCDCCQSVYGFYAGRDINLDNEFIRVVGNIYENPELLKEVSNG